VSNNKAVRYNKTSSRNEKKQRVMEVNSTSGRKDNS
jgi:hypothetical protein